MSCWSVCLHSLLILLASLFPVLGTLPLLNAASLNISGWALLPHVSHIPSWLPHVWALASFPLSGFSTLAFGGQRGATYLPFQFPLQLHTLLSDNSMKKAKSKRMWRSDISNSPWDLSNIHLMSLNKLTITTGCWNACTPVFVGGQ